MQKFYFTYAGTECGMPFIGGWTEVEAENEDEAVAKFRSVHPNEDDEDVLNCSFFYNDEMFGYTGMKETGNFGAFCHEVL